MIDYNLASDLYPILRQAAIRVCELSFEGDGPEWTVQGFGMMRCYLDPEKTWRLNIWHSRFMVPGVSVIHDHPWHFDSWILIGEFQNQRYIFTRYKPIYDIDGNAEEVQFATIMTGIKSNVGDAGGGGVEAGDKCWLIPAEIENYSPGSYYHQQASEIHKTVYTDGCVTINRRQCIGDGEHARVFWPLNQTWVSAKPRVATSDEVSDVIGSLDWSAH